MLRERLYSNYVSGRAIVLAPATIDGLEGRRPFLTAIVRRHFPADRSVSILDLGCGHGAFIHVAREEGYVNIRGVDTSIEQVNAARKLGIPGVEQADVFAALKKVPDNTLGVVLAFDLIEHFTDGELLRCTDEVMRVLKPGGRWLIHTPNGESPFVGRVLFGDLTHQRAFTSMSLSQLLIASGFGLVRSFEDDPKIHGPASFARYVLWRGFRAIIRLYVLAESGTSGSGILSQNFLTVAVKPEGE